MSIEIDLNSARFSVQELEDGALVEGFAVRLARERRTTAELLAYIDEIDRRGLWAGDGYSSMFAFCVERFHMSEPAAGKRIWAARTARRFPVIFEMVAAGDVHLTAITLLGRHLTGENHRDVLARARHRSKREVQLLVAEIAPQPDVPARIRALPSRSSPVSEPAQQQLAATAPAASPAAASAPAPSAPTERARPPAQSSPGERACTMPAATVPRPLSAPAGRVEPLAPRRYKIEVTVGQETHDRLREIQELLSHQIPNGDPATIIDLALALLLKEARKERMAQVSRPRSSERSARRTRGVPSEVRREVWRRDGGQCAFVAADGHRCTERRFVEVHHKHPFARGGEHTADNLELRCRAHNQHEADRAYGKPFMDRKRGDDRVGETLVPYLPVNILRRTLTLLPLRS